MNNMPFYRQIASGQYQYGGWFMRPKNSSVAQLEAAIQAGKIHTVISRYRDLEFDGKRIPVSVAEDNK
jgi:hypothetical protein